MTEFLRRGWDIRVAIENRRSAIAVSSRSAPSATAEGDAKNGAGAQSKSAAKTDSGAGSARRGSGAAGTPVRARRAARKVARRAARALPPEVRRPLKRVVGGAKRRLARSAPSQGAEDQLHRIHAVTTRELQAARADFVQQIQAARETLRRDLDDVYAAVQASDRQLRELARSVARVETYSLAAARRVAVNCGDGSVLVRTEVGFVLCAAGDHALLAQLLDVGDLEPGTRALITAVLRPGDGFVDLGANIGMHTVAAARAVGRTGHGIAIEAFGPTASLLERTLWINGLADTVRVEVAAVGAEPGLATLFLGPTSGHHSLFSLPAGDAVGTYEVEVKHLDDLVPAGFRVDLLKIDVEGAELAAIRSAERVLAENPGLGLIVEFGPAHLRRTGITSTEWFGEFERRSLVFRVIDPSSGVVREQSVGELENVDTANLLFARPDSPVWERVPR